MPSQSSLVGSAGEHYIMYKLLRNNLIAALAPEGAPNADIIVTDIEGNKTAVIQVKTRRDIGSDKGWHMKKKHETIVGERLFYCFVDLGSEEGHSPQVYVIPSSKVAEVIKRAHEIWLETPGRGGRKHKDTDMRRLLPDYSSKLPLSPKKDKMMGAGWMEKYHEKWDLLEIKNSPR